MTGDSMPVVENEGIGGAGAVRHIYSSLCHREKSVCLTRTRLFTRFQF